MALGTSQKILLESETVMRSQISEQHFSDKIANQLLMNSHKFQTYLTGDSRNTLAKIMHGRHQFFNCTAFEVETPTSNTLLMGANNGVCNDT